MLPVCTCERYGFEHELFGVPIEVSSQQPEGSFRLRCPGSAHGVEDAAMLWELQAPAEPVPAPTTS